MGSKKKIQIATDEERRQYASSSASGEGAASAGSAPPPPSEEASSPASSEPAVPEDEGADLRRQVGDLKDKYLRAKADFQNLQRRGQQERREAVRFANADFARSLLAVLDDFERTFEAASAENATVDSVVEGVRLVHESLKKALTDQGITEILTDVKPFDPNLHEAVMQQPSSDHPHMTVLQTLQKGYQHHERVLRPAKVVVSKAAEDSSAADQADQPSARPAEPE